MVRHDLGFVDKYSGSWMVQVPDVFLVSYLGFFPLASSVACYLAVVEVSPWLSSLRSFAVEGLPWFLSGTV